MSTVYASKEIVLAAGALHTPQILQLSGVGPRPLLDSLSIPVLSDLPGVGSNVQDQASLEVPYNCEFVLVPRSLTEIVICVRSNSAQSLIISSLMPTPSRPTACTIP